MSNFLDDVKLTLQPWKFLKKENRDKIRESDTIGSPLHGLKAGLKVFDLAKPWRPYEDLKTWKEQGFKKGIKTTLGRHKDAWGDVAEENWPVAALAGLYYAAPYVAGSLGGAGGGGGSGAAAQPAWLKWARLGSNMMQQQPTQQPAQQESTRRTASLWQPPHDPFEQQRAMRAAALRGNSTFSI